ncbi:AAA family ATPase [Nocardia cyriacigeorgica]|uniref:ATP-binding protein n=1 Tax=Nocardia cyriacigeorgica TaxID=135487 RepID=UPI0018942061|nr:LuxR family transcriptional regulator [Nocardia cyriacigeorgica]MBF6513600.1 AAA family ATPase [Nocardia cyriacigeorgica]
MLVGRDVEQVGIRDLLADAMAGHGRALAVRGEAGIGKSTLLRYAGEAAEGMRVLRGVGIESEAELGFGVLHMLLNPFADRIDRLPGPQAAALRAAFGQAEAAEVNRFLVGAATLTLLAELAAETPTLLLVDDAQWVDQSSIDALLFAARRFGEDAVAMILGVRDTAVPFPTPGIASMRLTGLPQEAAAELLDRCTPGLTMPGRARVLAESAGNPLALLELGGARRAAEASGRFDPGHEVGPLAATSRVQESFRAQIADLPAGTRTVLLIAAADSGTDIGTVLGVAAGFGLSGEDLEPAERAGLVSVDSDRLEFRHPLIRAAVYRNAPHHQRTAVHERFAAELTAPADADRRAWHLAAATTKPDESVAAVLEQTARRQQARGGAMAVSAAYDRAGRLSVDPERKANRILLAARAAYDAGKPDRATRLAAEAAALTDDLAIIADATHIRAQVEYERTSPAADAELSLRAAELIADLDPERAAFFLAEALCCARDAADRALLLRGTELLNSIRLPDDSPLRPHAAAQIAWADLLDGAAAAAAGVMAAQLLAAHGDAVDDLHKVVAAFSGLMLADDAAAAAIMDEMIAGARAIGELHWVPYGLEVAALAQMFSGGFGEARSAAAEGIALSEEIGMPIEADALRAIEVWLAAVSGDEQGCHELAAEIRPRLSATHRTHAALAEWGVALADLAAGAFDAALDRLGSVCAGPAAYDFLIRAVPDQVEAAVRAGRRERAGEHLAGFGQWAETVGTPLPAALSLRCSALLASGDDADDLYSAALAQHDKHGGPYDRARTQLVYGEWLRRRRRRADARAQLVEALDTFDQLGARAWLTRVNAELAALGDQPAAPRRTDPLAQLTPQETQVVRLAAAGYSNKEIGARLFLSPRTVGHHLYKAYPKLGITRRADLARFRL